MWHFYPFSISCREMDHYGSMFYHLHNFCLFSLSVPSPLSIYLDRLHCFFSNYHIDGLTCPIIHWSCCPLLDRLSPFLWPIVGSNLFFDKIFQMAPFYQLFYLVPHMVTIVSVMAMCAMVLTILVRVLGLRVGQKGLRPLYQIFVLYCH